MTVWYDRDRMTHGDAIVERMKDGLRDSRCGIIIASPSYFGKMFTTPELNALLMRVFADESRKVIPVLYRMTGRELSAVHPLLAVHRYIDGSQFDPAEIAAFIHSAISPGVEQDTAVALDATADTDVRRARELGVSPFSPGAHDAPYDALPEQPHLAAFRPRIEIAWYAPTYKNGHRAVSWSLVNAGAGEARDVHVFLPGIASYHASTLTVGQNRDDVRRFDDRYAYHAIMKPPIQAIVEFADVHGNVYREYADVQAGAHLNETPADYTTTQFGHPYPVSGRIVQPDTERDRFFLTTPIDFGA